MIHTVGEQIQGNKTRTLEIGGRESAKKKGGGVGKLDSTSSLRLDKDPRWAREVGNVRFYSCRSSVCWRVIHAPRACTVLGCWRQGVAWQQSPAWCLLPCIRALREKENFLTLSLRSAVENGSFYRAWPCPWRKKIVACLCEKQPFQSSFYQHGYSMDVATSFDIYFITQ